MPTITPRSATFDSGNLTVPGGLALSGNCQLTVFDDGTWSFRSHAHDAGATDIHYTVSAVLVPRSGKPYTFQHQGALDGHAVNVFGLFGHPKVSDDFVSSVTSGITDSFDDAVAGTFSANIDGNDVAFENAEDALLGALKAAGVAAASVAAAGAVALLF
jgi:hypothetical protein